MDPNLKIRILCDGWYDSETNRVCTRGSVFSGDRISGRLLTALETGETYRDRCGRELPVCENVIPTFQDLPVIVEPVKEVSNITGLPDVESSGPEEIKFIDPDSDAGDSIIPIRILEARMSVAGVKVVDLGIRK